ncbi:MAG: ATP-dependent Clp protease ATP-binding subunit ClpX, partial [Planctomycetes bacterium]|nr:ATP-dependent Clp protease ATP-binding subunit ClpX [Planctomycetota bacterium]
PKNALVKQFKSVFEMDGVQLEFTDEALGALADIAMTRETGVRSLRTMFEEVLLDLRFEIGSRKGENIVITAEFVQERLARTQRGDRAERRKRDSA